MATVNNTLTLSSTDLTTDAISLSVLNKATSTIVLRGGDWAVIPWSGSTRTTDMNLEAYGQVDNAILEFGVFQ